MEENMGFDMTEAPQLSKTWNFSEKVNKHTVHHTLSVDGNKLTHISEVHEASQAKKERSDVKLNNVRAVHTYYGLSRNIVLVVLVALLAVFTLMGSIAVFTSASESESYYDDDYYDYGYYYGSDYGYGSSNQTNKNDELDDDQVAAIVGGVVLLLATAGLAFLAYWLFKRVNPSFYLEIEMVENARKIFDESLSYGSIGMNFGKKKLSPIALLLMVVIWPIGLIYLLKKSKGGTKYRFVMDPETGYEIVDTLGEYLIPE